MVEDKRHKQEHAQILHRNIMGMIVQEVLPKQNPATQKHVQVKSLQHCLLFKLFIRNVSLEVHQMRQTLFSKYS